jgi:peptide/nickel transport system substrate-binding protein
LAEFKANEPIKLIRNPHYWKPCRPYLDGIDYVLSHSRSAAILAFLAGKYDLTFAGVLTVTPTRDLQRQRPDASCELRAAAGQCQHKPDRQSVASAVR